MQFSYDKPRFESADVVRATGVGSGTLQTRLARRLIRASHEIGGPGHRRLYSFNDILGLAAAESLTKMGLSITVASDLIQEASSEPKWWDVMKRCEAGLDCQIFIVVLTDDAGRLHASAFAPVPSKHVDAMLHAMQLAEDGVFSGPVNDSESGCPKDKPGVSGRPLRFAVFDVALDMLKAAETLKQINLQWAE